MRAIMSMQDVSDGRAASDRVIDNLILCQVILTERWRKKQYIARWLQYFKRGQKLLQIFNPDSRFWKNNVQHTSLRISLTVIIGRAVILSQPMTELSPASSMNPKQEVKRFDWLLFGTEEEMYEIHGGCGFSKKLLHIISQITYCAARLQQEKESPVVPVTAHFLHKELRDMRLWSSESSVCEAVAVHDHLTIDWVRQVVGGYIINDSETMTCVTAEAWRIAAIIYLQCRVMR